ncbi:hypothetical protein AB0M48_38810 [Lentzea sp. NPDC051208]|uniref:hypothetical protein n=1 Tax=Lentzea sp. NPDC051208 TaxID=3154642 RepID=UPI0034120C86
MPFDPGTAAQSTATGALGSIANLAYTIVMSSKTDVQFEASHAGAFSTIPEGVDATKVERVEWHGLWYTHTRWFGMFPKSIRNRVNRLEVKDNLDAQRVDEFGKTTGKLDLGTAGLFLPLVISYDLYRIDVQPTIATLSAREAELTKQLIAARKDLVEAQAQGEEALLYNHQRAGDRDRDRLRRTVRANLRELERQVRRFEADLEGVRVAILDTEDVRRAQTEALTTFMHNFRIAPTNEYLGQRLHIPGGVVGKGKFEMSAVADHFNPSFQITFNWREQFWGRDSYPPYAETFRWYADAGPQGGGKFVTRFTTGARRMGSQVDGRKSESKPIYDGTRRPSSTAPQGTRAPYDPTPEFQLPVRKTQDQLIAENRGLRYEYDVDLNPPIPVTHQPAEKTSSVPGESVWAKLLADHHVDLDQVRDSSSSRPSRRQRFYQSAVAVDHGVKEYWQRYLDRGPRRAGDVRALLPALIDHTGQLEANARRYAESLRSEHRRRSREIEKFADKCRDLADGMRRARDRA